MYKIHYSNKNIYDQKTPTVAITIETLKNKMLYEVPAVNNVDIKKSKLNDLYKIKLPETYDNVVSIDIDNISLKKASNKNATELMFEVIKKISNVYYAFISPSGKGIKLFCKVDGVNNVNTYKQAYNKMSNIINNSKIKNYFNYKIDNVGHITNGTGWIFIHKVKEEQIYYNPNTTTLSIEYQKETKKKKNDVIKENDNNIVERNGNNKCIKELESILNENNKVFKIGQRNDYCYALANMANENGIKYKSLIDYMNTKYGNEFEIEEVLTIKSVYEKKKNKHNTTKTRETLLKEKVMNSNNQIENNKNQKNMVIKEKLSEIIQTIKKDDKKHIIINAPTGSGKTYAMLNNLNPDKLNVLAVPTKVLRDNISSEYNINIFDGEYKGTIKKGTLLVCTYDQLYRFKEYSLLNNIELIIDEAHQLILAASYRETCNVVISLLNKFYKVYYLSGTWQPIANVKNNTSIYKISFENPLQKQIDINVCKSPRLQTMNDTIGKLKKDKKIIYLVNSLNNLNRITNELSKNKIKYIDIHSGNDNTIESYNSGEVNVIVGTTKIAEGISVTRDVDEMIIVDCANHIAVAQFIARSRVNEPKITMYLSSRKYNNKGLTNLDKIIPSVKSKEKLTNILLNAKKQAEKNNTDIIDEINIEKTFNMTTQIENCFNKYGKILDNKVDTLMWNIHLNSSRLIGDLFIQCLETYHNIKSNINENYSDEIEVIQKEINLNNIINAIDEDDYKLIDYNNEKIIKYILNLFGGDIETVKNIIEEHYNKYKEKMFRKLKQKCKSFYRLNKINKFEKIKKIFDDSIENGDGIDYVYSYLNKKTNIKILNNKNIFENQSITRRQLTSLYKDMIHTKSKRPNKKGQSRRRIYIPIKWKTVDDIFNI